MIKRLLTAVSAVLALNFLVVLGGVGWLYRGGHLDRQKLTAIRQLLFPPENAAATQPSDLAGASTQPTLKLDELLAKSTGRSTTDQVQFIQHAFDSQSAEMDRRQLELRNLEQQVETARVQLAKDRAALVQQQKVLDDRAQEANKLAVDQGFQNSLELYNAMPAAKAKTIFMSLDDDTVARYLQAMQPRTATKIINEFKTPDELTRIEKVLEKVRLSQAAAQK